MNHSIVLKFCAVGILGLLGGLVAVSTFVQDLTNPILGSLIPIFRYDEYIIDMAMDRCYLDFQYVSFIASRFGVQTFGELAAVSVTEFDAAGAGLEVAVQRNLKLYHLAALTAKDYGSNAPANCVGGITMARGKIVGSSLLADLYTFNIPVHYAEKVYTEPSVVSDANFVCTTQFTTSSV